METVWIIGVGRFGSIAVKKLSKQHKTWQFVLVDPDKENLEKVTLPNVILEQTDGVSFLNDRLTPAANVSWIIPSLPVHLAWEWCRVKVGSELLVRTSDSTSLESFLPNPVKGSNKDIYVSNADFICPSNCSEPTDLCTVTQQPRKKDMFKLLESLAYKDYTPIVLRSRQLGPGIGGYSPLQLFSFLDKVKQVKGPMLLCTACRCHGVITGVTRV